MLHLTQNLMRNRMNQLPISQNKSKWLKNLKNQTVAEKRISTLSIWLRVKLKSNFSGTVLRYAERF